MSTAAADPVVDSTVKESAHDSAHDVALTPFTIFRYIASIGLLIFSIIIVGALIFTGNTRVASETNPWVALIVCVSVICLSWFCIRCNIFIFSAHDMLTLYFYPPVKIYADPCRRLVIND